MSATAGGLRWVLGCVALAGATGLGAQQVADTLFAPAVDGPAYPAGQGPAVVIDGGHHNFHTAEGRFAPFARLLRRDGLRVRGSEGPLTPASLEGVDLLVIANALNERNIEDWSLPTPSAFTADEIHAVRSWVEGGGALLLIADHMPFPGAAGDLAAAFGFRFRNGFANDTLGCAGCPIGFRRTPPESRAGGRLARHPVTTGSPSSPDSVFSFTGQAFEAPADAEPVLVLGPGTVLLLPEEAWVFDENTRREPAAGLLQGATRVVGAGRVAAFGEAAMFTAQRAGPDGSIRMGMNAPVASENGQLVLNVVRWLVAR